jgi:osmotically-inducible protein OsmY
MKILKFPSNVFVAVLLAFKAVFSKKYNFVQEPELNILDYYKIEKSRFFVVAAVIILIFLTSCVEAVVFGSAGFGILTVREKSFSNTGKDVLIASKLGSVFIANGLKKPGDSVDITVNEGRVLLTGMVRTPQKANLAYDLSWKVENVKEVIDEIQLGEEKELHFKDFSNAATDYTITLEIEAKLLVLKAVSSVNYKITTVNKIVYIIGIAEDKAEMKKVLSAISKIQGVKKVVNHIILADDDRRG